MAKYTDNKGHSYEIKRPEIFTYYLMLESELKPTEERLKGISSEIEKLNSKLRSLEAKIDLISQATSNVASIASSIGSIHSNVLQLIRQNNGMEIVQTLQDELTLYKNDFYHKLLKDMILNTHIYIYRQIAYKVKTAEPESKESKEYNNILNLIKRQLETIGIETEESRMGTPYDSKKMEKSDCFRSYTTSNQDEDATVALSIVPRFYWKEEDNIEPQTISKEEVALYEYEDDNESNQADNNQ